jgi:phage tail-like protein
MADQSSNRKDPLPVFCFKVEFSELKTVAFFKSVGGIGYEREVVDVKEGGNNNTTRQLMGAMKWKKLVLKQGFTGSSDLLTWFEKWMAEGGTKTRTSGKIIQMDTALTAVCQWEWEEGWPCKWEMGELDASKNELGIETIEIAHEGLTFKKL